MAAITASMVNELRTKTGVGMMECKKALTKCAGNMELAIEELRKAGMAKAEEKAGRAAKNGIIAARSNGKTAAFVEFLCETDFAAKTAAFKDFGGKLAEVALAMEGDGDISAALIEKTAADVKAQVGVVKENMMVRRAVRWTSANGKVAYYIHSGAPYAVLVELEGECDDTLANQICMHVCASAPEYITRDQVPADRVAKELDIAMGQVKADPKTASKPEQVQNGIAQGKLNKWYSGVCLMEQPWIMDNKSTLAKVAPKVKVVRMIRWLVGEEI